MTIWLPDIKQFPGPRYQALAMAIEQAVRDGTLAPGDRLPPQRDLAWKLGVTVGTVSRGYMLAEQKGLLSGEVGRGTYVKPPGEPQPLPFFSAGEPLPPIADLRSPNMIELSRNEPTLPDYEGIMQRTLQTLSAKQGLSHLLSYSRMLGDPAHRVAAAHWMGRTGVNFTADQVIATAGAQQALCIAIAGLADPGETLLVESLTYGGIHENARLRTARLHAVQMDAEGMLPEALDKAAQQTGARTVLLQPTLHNPTTATMSLRRREDIVTVARQRDLTIIEDDVYGLMPEHRPLPLAVLAPERTVYVSSASKCMAPGLRVGWLAAPLALIERFGDALHAIAVNNPRLNQEIVRMWIEDGTAENMLNMLRVETRARQHIAAEYLQGRNFRADPASLHAYVELPDPWKPNDFTAQALMQGVRIASCTSFVPDYRSNPAPWVRLSLAASPNRDSLREGLSRLRGLMDRGPEKRQGVV